MYKQLSHEEAELLIGERDVVIADVRDVFSFSEGHIKNAIHLSVPALQEFCETADRNQAILLYCFHGISSQSVAQHLVEQGFTEVYSLIGGFETWKAHHPTSESRS